MLNGQSFWSTAFQCSVIFIWPLICLTESMFKFNKRFLVSIWSEILTWFRNLTSFFLHFVNGFYVLLLGISIGPSDLFQYKDILFWYMANTKKKTYCKKVFHRKWIVQRYLPLEHKVDHSICHCLMLSLFHNPLPWHHPLQPNSEKSTIQHTYTIDIHLEMQTNRNIKITAVNIIHFF